MKTKYILLLAVCGFTAGNAISGPGDQYNGDPWWQRFDTVYPVHHSSFHSTLYHWGSPIKTTHFHNRTSVIVSNPVSSYPPYTRD